MDVLNRPRLSECRVNAADPPRHSRRHRTRATVARTFIVFIADTAFFAHTTFLAHSASRSFAVITAITTLTLLTVLGVGLARAEDAGTPEPRLIALEPAIRGPWIVCRVLGEGLPGEAALETLKSGLPTSILLDFLTHTPGSSESRSRRVLVQVEPDLWEGDYRVRWNEGEHRYPDLSGLRVGLGHLGPFAVAPVPTEESARRRFDARMQVFPVAAEDKAAELGIRQEDETSSERQRSIGFGSLFRFLFGKRESREVVTLELGTEPVAIDTLPRIEVEDPVR